MKLLTHHRSPLLMAVLILGVWFFISRNKTTSPSQEENPPQTHAKQNHTTYTPEDSNTRATRRQRDPATDPLANVRSPLAKRYLRLMSNHRSGEGEDYDLSIAKYAFNEAWGVTARIDLTEEQQDRLAEFLFQQNFTKLTLLDTALVEQWAKAHLSDAQRAGLLAYIAESKNGELDLADMQLEDIKRKQGVGPSEEASPAQAEEIKRLSSFQQEGYENLSDEEIRKRMSILEGLMKSTASDQSNSEESYHGEHAAQRFQLLADRIPLTEPQQMAIYAALEKGISSPIDANAYKLTPDDQIESQVRANTAWLRQSITPAQYETYLRHHLAEIEMIRFKAP